MANRHVDDFDDDGYDDEYDGDGYAEEGGNELSTEDQASMAKGTAEVREALGPASSKVTLAQIQDALWHYYYDVEKSVAYLTKTYVSPTPKPAPKPASKKLPEGMFNKFSCSEPYTFPPGDPRAGHQRSSFGDIICQYSGQRIHAVAGISDLELPRRSLSAYFSDMPWLNTPEDRQATFIAPERPWGGLLGGAEGTTPLTKLQKLAAARKKKSDEKKEGSKIDKTQDHMKQLSLSDEGHKEISNTAVPSAKRQKLTTPMGDPERLSSQSSKDLEDDKTGAPKIAASPVQPLPSVIAPQVEDIIATSPRPTPSAFARTLIGPARGSHVNNTPEHYPMPYTLSSAFTRAPFDEPSPDDIVLAAQAKAGKKSTPSAAKSNKSKESSGKAPREEEAAAGVSNLKISDVPPPKSKGLDVVKEFEKSSSKRSVSFVVVGHVDAGKSTLMGRLLLELEHVERRTVDKYRRQAEKAGKQSFALAWVMDQRSEERERGVTIDIATNYFETEKTRFTILDAPGHKDFVPNMIAGASQADFAILVIDANTGAYEKGLKGQTREHVLLLRSVGVQRVVVAINKLDMVGYSKDRFDEITQEVTGFLHGLGFQEKNVSFVPISGLNGDNIVRSIEDEAASWYKGETLIEALEASGPSVARALRKPLRMAISEVFRSQQGTTTLAGRVDSGTMQLGDVLVVQPSGETAHIKSIVVDKENVEWAVAGQNVSMALVNIDPIHIRVGDIVCHPSDAIACGDSFTMKAMAFEHLLPSPVDLHRGRLHVPGRIQTIVASLDKATGQVIKKKPKVVQPGGVARVVIKLESRVPLEAGQRVVIRSGGETVAAGLME